MKCALLMIIKNFPKVTRQWWIWWNLSFTRTITSLMIAFSIALLSSMTFWIRGLAVSAKSSKLNRGCLAVSKPHRFRTRDSRKTRREVMAILWKDRRIFYYWLQPVPHGTNLDLIHHIVVWRLNTPPFVCNILILMKNIICDNKWQRTRHLYTSSCWKI